MENLLGPRDANGIPVPMTVDESIASMKASLLKKIKRSAYVYRVDCGGCNGCEIEIFATLSPLFDAERFGIKVVPSPRHADILLFPDIQAGNLVYFMTVDNCRFRRPVVPGDRVEFHVQKMKQRGNIWKFHCDAKVDGHLVAEADYSAMIRSSGE